MCGVDSRSPSISLCLSLSYNLAPLSSSYRPLRSQSARNYHWRLPTRARRPFDTNLVTRWHAVLPRRRTHPTEFRLLFSLYLSLQVFIRAVKVCLLPPEVCIRFHQPGGGCIRLHLPVEICFSFNCLHPSARGLDPFAPFTFRFAYVSIPLVHSASTVAVCLCICLPSVASTLLRARLLALL